MNDIDVSDIPRATLLAALYNNARAQGLGFLHHTPEPMTEDEAAEILGDGETDSYFDYLRGRVMKVEINGKTLDPWLYDRDKRSRRRAARGRRGSRGDVPLASPEKRKADLRRPLSF